MYILKCADDSYYTGSTIDLKRRLRQHQNGQGANHTKKRLPVQLVYSEEYQRIDHAFYREKQVQGWSRKKKEALIFKNHQDLPELSIAYRDRVDFENPQSTPEPQSTRVHQSTREHLSTREPQSTRVHQSTREPQSTRVHQSIRGHQSTRGHQSIRKQQSTR